MPVRRAQRHFIDHGVLWRAQDSGTYVCGRDGRRLGTIGVLSRTTAPACGAAPSTPPYCTASRTPTPTPASVCCWRTVTRISTPPCASSRTASTDSSSSTSTRRCCRRSRSTRAKRKPLVLINYPHATPLFDCVVTDNARRPVLAGHLIGHGHQRIACLFGAPPPEAGGEPHSSVGLKLAGYRQSTPTCRASGRRPPAACWRHPQAAPTRSTIVLHGAVLERASVRTVPR